MASRRFSVICRHMLKPSVISTGSSTFQACASTTVHHRQPRFPIISAEPRVALYDEKICIKFDDFPSNEKITLHGQYFQGQQKQIFASCGHYKSDEFGHVNVTEQPSTGGTYTGLEPMGILWSLQSAPGQSRFSRMLMKSTDTPGIIHLKAYKGHLQLKDIYESPTEPECLADLQLERWLRFPSEVKRIEVEAGNVRGALYLPPGDGPFQGVIDMFGSSGGIIEYRAAMLASRGFAALSLPYFKYKDLPKDFSEVTLDYCEEAVEYLLSHPKVSPHGVGVVGVSKGVELAYCMGTHLDKVKCVVCINGYPYITLHDFYYKGKLLYKGSEFQLGRCEMTKDEELIISEAMPFTDNLIPAWKGNTKYLILVSEDDYQIIIDNYKLLFESCPDEKLNNFEVKRYPGAGHLLEPPYTALCRSAVNPAYQTLMLFGGHMKEHAHAQEDSWNRILNHLRENIPIS